MGLLFAAFVVLPFVELYLLIRIGRVVGLAPTLLLVIATGLLGAYLAKHQGRQVLHEWQRALSEGRVPGEGVLHGALVLLGGLLLIVPGVITDVAGLALLVPWTRRLVAQGIHRALERQIASGQVQVHGFGFGSPFAHGSPYGHGPRMGPTPYPRDPRGGPTRRDGPTRDAAPTEVGYGPGRRTDVIDTEGEEIP